jgi:regulator of sigma E protease
MSILLTIIIFAFILGLLIFVHELGHFVVAKRAGMKVEEFGFGFPPRLFGIKKGETVYSLNLIPLGGFVKVLGEDPGAEGEDDPRSFSRQGFWPRLLVLLAGVLMNFVFAWFLFFLAFWVIGSPIEVGPGSSVPPGVKLSQEQLAIISVLPDTPAQEAGFRPGDAIVSVDGTAFSDIGELIDYNTSHAGSEVVYVLRRGGEELTRTVVPRVDYPEGSGPVGFAPALLAIGKFPFLAAIPASVVSLFERTGAILGAFGLLIANLFKSGQLAEGLAGPIGIAVLTRDFATLGVVYLVQFTAILSINLAIINALPFPALDGGRVLFLLIEKARGAKSVKWEHIANAVGFVLLIILMIVVTVKDISRYGEQFKNLFERLI